MIFIPAIDISEGRVVRRIRGLSSAQIVYGEDPVAFAHEFEGQGAEWVHVVDLDGATEGKSRNLESLRRIRSESKLKIEFGGGLRTEEVVASVMRMGIDRAILGTKALEGDFLTRMVKTYGDKVAVSLDVSEGEVCVQGWTQKADMSRDRILVAFRELGLRTMIVTNIMKDGTLGGPDTDGFESLLHSCSGIDLILSGGVSSLNDLRVLVKIKEDNFYGVIVGRAIYEQKFSVREAIRVLKASGELSEHEI